MSYCNLAESYQELKLTLAQNQASPEVIDGNAFLIQAQDFITARIDQETQNTFAPLLDTFYFDAGLNSDNLDWYQNQLMLHFPLLEAIEVKVLDNALTEWDGVQANYPSSDYYPTPRNRTPYYKLQGTQWPFSPWNPYFFNSPLNPMQAFLQSISVKGLWGYRQFYDRDGWKASGDTILNIGGINDSATTITVANINGVQYNNVTPRFSPGQWIRITTASVYEFMEIVDTTVTTGMSPVNTLTVIRGVRGTTPIAHNHGDAIDIYYVQPEIVRAAQRWVAWLYQKRGTFDQTTYNFGIGTASATTFPQDAPTEVQNILNLFKNQEAVSAV